jgi:DNA invertase Pin-like site-specific DNA recombinase
VKRAALYLRVSTVDQHPETQGLELRRFAQERGYEIVQEPYRGLGRVSVKQSGPSRCGVRGRRCMEETEPEF